MKSTCHFGRNSLLFLLFIIFFCLQSFSGKSQLRYRTPVVATNPANSSVCSGSSSSFAVTITYAVTYQWQVNTGAGYTNITNGGIYSGATTATLSISATTTGMNGYLYKCIGYSNGPASNPYSATTTAGTLTVFAPATYYQDLDNDGYGNPNVTTSSCSGTPTGYVANSTDCDDTNAAIHPGQSVWLGSSNNLWSNTANWSCGVLPTDTSDVIINNTSNMPQVDITTAVCKNLTIGSGASLTVSSGMILDVKGTITNSGSFSTTGKAIFSGADQTIPGGNYADLEIGGAGTKTLNGAATVTGTLTLTAGSLQLGNNNLTVNSISGASASRYIITNGTGALKQQNIGTAGLTGDILFPVGTASSYTPISINNAGIADEFGARVINNVYDSYNGSDVPAGASQTTNNVNKTWILTEGTPGGSNVTLGFQWNSGDELPGFNRTTSVPSHYTGGYWHPGSGSAALGSNPYTISMSGITSFSPFGIGSSGSVLPLTLVSFTSKEKAEGIYLQWTTANEINTEVFDIERSVNGKDFIKIGSVAAGTSNAYSYTDNSAAGGTVYMYRLKMRDKDNKYTYSFSISAKHIAKVTTSYSVYPNPTTGAYLYIQPSSINDTSIQLAVIDMMGRIWYNHAITSADMSNGYFKIPVNQLPRGSYVLHISDKKGECLQVIKFTVAD